MVNDAVSFTCGSMPAPAPGVNAPHRRGVLGGTPSRELRVLPWARSSKRVPGMDRRTFESSEPLSHAGSEPKALISRDRDVPVPSDAGFARSELANALWAMHSERGGSALSLGRTCHERHSGKRSEVEAPPWLVRPSRGLTAMSATLFAVTSLAACSVGGNDVGGLQARRQRDHPRTHLPRIPGRRSGSRSAKRSSRARSGTSRRGPRLSASSHSS